jgi:hypothetical protein
LLLYWAFADSSGCAGWCGFEWPICIEQFADKIPTLVLDISDYKYFVA